MLTLSSPRGDLALVLFCCQNNVLEGWLHSVMMQAGGALDSTATFVPTMLNSVIDVGV